MAASPQARTNAKARARRAALGLRERPAVLAESTLAAITTTAKDRLGIAQADAIGALASAAYAVLVTEPDGLTARELLDRLAVALHLPANEVARRLTGEDSQPALPLGIAS